MTIKRQINPVDFIRFWEYLKSPGRLRRIYLWTLGIITLFIILTFSFRNIVFEYYLQRKVKAFNHANKAELVIPYAKIRGISSMEIRGLSLKPLQSDTLLAIDTAYASVSFLNLLIGRIVLSNFEMKGFMLNLVRRDSLTNYMFLLERTKKRSSDTTATRNYAARASLILRAAFDKIPDKLLIRDFNLKSTTNEHVVCFHLDQLNVEDHVFNTDILVSEGETRQDWKLDGQLNPHDRLARFRIFRPDGKKISFPYIKFKYDASVEFDTLQFSLAVGRNDEIVSLNGLAGITGLEMEHPRISTEKVILDKTSLSYVFNIGNDYLEMDSATTVTFNNMTINPYLRYRPKPSKQIRLRLHKKDFSAKDLFSSLPAGLFQNLKGIEVSGMLDFNLDFEVDLSIPDSLKFECYLDPHKFKIIHYGATDLGKMNQDFEYTAFENGEPVRTFNLGPENPNFRRLDQIPSFLKNAVLNSEDGAFFGHRGFLIESFRESIVANIKAAKFVRGGSTISMQLIKNVFLNRNKTVARKLEEAMIVWMIENKGITSKERMFEVYLNLIEWGPLVYGAEEGAKFYFNKDVSKLSLAEAIFMASVIPRPKHFQWSFDKESGLRDFVLNYYKLMSEKMLRKEMITQEDFDRLRPVVDLKGPAKLLLKPMDSIPADSLNVLINLTD
ncbi:MAG: biosynthetic peptidoglycan transglycosylase [Bacteroidota bacterium]